MSGVRVLLHVSMMNLKYENCYCTYVFRTGSLRVSLAVTGLERIQHVASHVKHLLTV